MYVAVLVENENVRLLEYQDRSMVNSSFIERGQRNYGSTIFCFAPVLLESFGKLVVVVRHTSDCASYFGWTSIGTTVVLYECRLRTFCYQNQSVQSDGLILMSF